MTTPIPDEVLRQIERPAPGSDGPACLHCVTGAGMDSVNHYILTTTLARELLQAREALRYYANRDNYRHARDEDGYDYPAPVEWEDDEGGRARACLPESQ